MHPVRERGPRREVVDARRRVVVERRVVGVDGVTAPAHAVRRGTDVALDPLVEGGGPRNTDVLSAHDRLPADRVQQAALLLGEVLNPGLPGRWLPRLGDVLDVGNVSRLVGRLEEGDDQAPGDPVEQRDRDAHPRRGRQPAPSPPGRAPPARSHLPRLAGKLIGLPWRGAFADLRRRAAAGSALGRRPSPPHQVRLPGKVTTDQTPIIAAPIASRAAIHTAQPPSGPVWALA